MLNILEFRIFDVGVFLVFCTLNAKNLAFSMPDTSALRASTSHNSNSTLFYHSKKPLYHYTIPFYNTSNFSNFYFPTLLIKIIYLRNKIIYCKIISFLSYLSLLSNF